MPTDSAVLEAVAQQTPYRLERPTVAECGPLLKELTPLMAQCWQPHLNETGLSFNPDWLKIVKLLATGELLLFTARKDGKVVGYQMWTVADYYMSMGTRVGFCHRIFGGSKLGVNPREFLRFSLGELKHLGVRSVFFSARKDSAAARVYMDAGATEQEIMLGMDLWR